MREEWYLQGYLLDEFLRDGSNQRSGPYGSPLQNRARLILEVIEAVSAVWGSDRVGLRISTLNSYNSMIDSDPVRLSTWLAKRLNDCRLEYLHGMRGDFFQQQTAGARALRLLGFPAYTAERAARRFSRHVLKTAAELATVHHGQSAYVAMIRERVAALESLFRAAPIHPDGLDDHAWDLLPHHRDSSKPDREH